MVFYCKNEILYFIYYLIYESISYFLIFSDNLHAPETNEMSELQKRFSDIFIYIYLMLC